MTAHAGASHRMGQPSRLRTFTAMTRTSSCSSVWEKFGVAGNAEAARVNGATAGSPKTVEGTQRPSIRSHSWAWITAAHARHVFFEACGSDAEAPWRIAKSPDPSPPVRFTHRRMRARRRVDPPQSPGVLVDGFRRKRQRDLRAARVPRPSGAHSYPSSATSETTASTAPPAINHSTADLPSSSSLSSIMNC